MDKIKIVIVLILVSFTFVSKTDARLGENRGQCEKRYGIPILGKIGEVYDQYYFKKNDFTVMVFIINGKCQMIIYYKEGNLTNKPFSKEEIEKLLSSNSQGFKWRISDTKSKAFESSDELEIRDLFRSAMEEIIWLRGDDTMAIYNKLDNELVFMTGKAGVIGNKNGPLDGF